MADNLAYGLGRRKTSVARVYLRDGDGKITVNGKEVNRYFPNPEHVYIVQQPLMVTEGLSKFNLFINVKGGGTTGQAGACRHGIARALARFDETNRKSLRANGFLTRDPEWWKGRSMVSAEHGGSSSSPNGKIISEIVQGAAGSVEIRFSDGSSFFVRSQDSRYAVGDNLNYEDTEYLSAMAEVVPAKSKAIEILAMRDHSRAQLKQKLKKRGFAGSAVDIVLSELTDAGYLDDRRFALHWIEERLRKHPESLGFLVLGLMKRGVSRETAGDAVDAYADENTEVMALERAAEKIMKKSGMTAQRFVRAMASRGFTASRIYHARDRFFPNERDL